MTILQMKIKITDKQLIPAQIRIKTQLLKLMKTLITARIHQAILKTVLKILQQDRNLQTMEIPATHKALMNKHLQVKKTRIVLDSRQFLSP